MLAIPPMDTGGWLHQSESKILLRSSFHVLLVCFHKASCSSWIVLLISSSKQEPWSQRSSEVNLHHCHCSRLSLLHCEGDPVGRHWPCLDGDPQVVLVIARTLFLLGFWFGCNRALSAAAGTAAAAAAAVATAAAVAAHHQGGEEDQQRQSEEDHQADGVVESLVVLVGGEAPELVEELLDVTLTLHAFLHSSLSVWQQWSFIKFSAGLWSFASQ